MFVIVEDNKVVTLGVDNGEFPMAIEAHEDIICGDIYINGEFQRVDPRPDPQPIAPIPPSLEGRTAATEAAILTLMEVLG